jgi:hypothetical protein
MRLRSRLQRLERRAGVDRVREDAEVVEIWLPYDGRGGLPPGRYPVEGTPNAIIIYEAALYPSMSEAQPCGGAGG